MSRSVTTGCGPGNQALDLSGLSLGETGDAPSSRRAATFGGSGRRTVPIFRSDGPHGELDLPSEELDPRQPPGPASRTELAALTEGCSHPTGERYRDDTTTSPGGGREVSASQDDRVDDLGTAQVVGAADRFARGDQPDQVLCHLRGGDGVEPPTPRDGDDGQAGDRPQAPKKQFVELGRAQHRPRKTRALDLFLALAFGPVVVEGVAIDPDDRGVDDVRSALALGGVEQAASPEHVHVSPPPRGDGARCAGTVHDGPEAPGGLVEPAGGGQVPLDVAYSRYGVRLGNPGQHPDPVAPSEETVDHVRAEHSRATGDEYLGRSDLLENREHIRIFSRPLGSGFQQSGRMVQETPKHRSVPGFG